MITNHKETLIEHLVSLNNPLPLWKMKKPKRHKHTESSQPSAKIRFCIKVENFWCLREWQNRILIKKKKKIRPPETSARSVYNSKLFHNLMMTIINWRRKKKVNKIWIKELVKSKHRDYLGRRTSKYSWKRKKKFEIKIKICNLAKKKVKNQSNSCMKMQSRRLPYPLVKEIRNNRAVL